MSRASRVSWSCLLGTLALAAGAVPPLAATQDQPSPPVVFRSGVEAVQIDAVVTDRRGNLVTGLTADDFEISEGGRPQAIESFWEVDIPIVRHGAGTPESAGAPPLPMADVQMNGQEHGRIYVFVLGDVGWQGAMRARQHLVRFLEDHFGDTDLATVVSLNRGGAMRFTNDRALIATAAGYVFAGRDEDGMTPTDPLPSLDRARDQTRLFGEIAEALAGIPARRKAILLISETLGFDAFDVVDNPRSSFSRDARAALEPVTRNNITIYTLHPGGAISPFGLRPGAGSRGGGGRRGASRLRLSSLAHVTGGFSIGSDVRKAFEQIVRENSTYYVLGYYSSQTQRNRGYQRVQVRVTRPGLTVRSRSGYFVADRAAPARTFDPPVTISPAITDALASPVPLNTIPMQLFAAPFRAEGNEAAVALVAELDASALDMVEHDGLLSGLVDVTSIGVSGAMTYPGVRHTGELQIPAELRGTPLPLRILSEIRLPPGRYQLRMAAGLREGRTGSVLYDLTVPDFRREPLMLSGIAVTSLESARVTTLEAKDTIGDRLPAPATTAREFDRHDTLVIFAEVYENLWNDTEHTIHFRTALRGADGGVRPMTTEQRSSLAPRGEQEGHGFTATLPLREVPPGAYMLQVEAEADIDRRVPVSREVAIRVR